MELHYKVTTWNKLIIEGNFTKEEIIEKLEQGCMPLEIGYEKILPGVEYCDFENILETEEYVTLEENDGQSTIELMDDDPTELGLKCIWDNSYDSQIKRKKIINEKSN